jgi:hypothetical protein
MDQDNAIVVQESSFLAPAATLAQLKAAYQIKKDFMTMALVETVDYGKIPGANKPALFKAGAEKAVSLFGLAVEFEDIEKVEDFTGKDHDGEAFIYYRIKCKLSRNGKLVGSADGSCNSWEKKYRFRWVPEDQIPADVDKAKLKTEGGKIFEFDFAIDKAETSGKYGKPQAYWDNFKAQIQSGAATKTSKKVRSGREMSGWEINGTVYALPNQEVADSANTILKMAQKRALVAAVLITTGLSDYFTQDIEDFIKPGDFIEGQVKEVSEAGNPPTEQAPAGPVHNIPTMVAEALQYGFADQNAVFSFLKEKGITTFHAADYDQYVAMFREHYQQTQTPPATE